MARNSLRDTEDGINEEAFDRIMGCVPKRPDPDLLAADLASVDSAAGSIASIRTRLVEIDDRLGVTDDKLTDDIARAIKLGGEYQAWLEQIGRHLHGLRTRTPA